MKHAIKRAIRQNPATSTIVLAGAGTVAAVGLLWWLVERKASAATPSAAPAASNTVTLTPGPMTIRAAQGVSVKVNLPQGNAGQIVSVTDSNKVPILVDPTGVTFSWAPQTSGFVTVVWNSSSGGQQTTTLNYAVVNESGQTV